MNIMLVSVIERTREIGIKKSIGALNSEIRSQFIIEAIFICIIGGIIGILIGLCNGYLIKIIASYAIEQRYKQYRDIITITVKPSIKAIVVSLSASSIIGIAFGFYPANKAAKMNPIDALRYE